ncbi:hypothetical protein [Schaalia suimastitidis]|uniref:hypothetical protein n=1 Tax=Schaalia suimastitidis TaxID=121163 RepID=UPI00047C6656|nr:hypothetical protein [Schaalia suimastitidis]
MDNIDCAPEGWFSVSENLDVIARRCGAFDSFQRCRVQPDAFGQVLSPIVASVYDDLVRDVCAGNKTVACRIERVAEALEETAHDFLRTEAQISRRAETMIANIESCQ